MVNILANHLIGRKKLVVRQRGGGQWHSNGVGKVQRPLSAGASESQAKKLK